MNAELQGYGDQLLSVRQDGVGLMSGLTEEQFNWRPAPGRWSIGGCIDHLNKSAAGLFIPKIDGAIADARKKGLKSDGPFAYSAFARWFIGLTDAPPKMKFTAPKSTQPAPHLPLDATRDEFVRWQEEFGKRLRDADGLDLRRAKESFPFWPVTWSLGAFMLLMIAHERRHILQAREVRQNRGFPR